MSTLASLSKTTGRVEQERYAFANGSCLRIDGEPYQVRRPIGAGNIADVYLVRNVKTGKLFAMKHLYHDYATDPKRYYGKLKLITTHSNPHPAFVWPSALGEYDSGSNSFCYLMPLVPDGYRPLSYAIVNPDALTREQKLEICRHLAEAFSRLQKIKWVYGDCSANNFLYRIDKNGKPQIKILDCDTITQEGYSFGLSGTGRYRAPEVMLGKPLSLQSDAHALAAVLFHLLIGCNALDGSYSSPKGMTEEDILRYYGKKPIFIFDQSGKNKPLYPHLYDRFAELPDALQAYFRVMFSQTRLTGKAPRPGPDVLYRIL